LRGKSPGVTDIPGVGVPPELAATMTIAEQHDWLRDFLRRHPVSRRSALRGTGAAVAALALSVSPFGRMVHRAYAADGVSVMGRRVAYGNDPTSQMTLAGELTGPPGSIRVQAEFGETTDFGTRVDAEVRALLSQVPQVDGAITGAEQYFVHAPLTGLRPGTSYSYRFRLSDGTTTPPATFTTAPDRMGVAEPFTFTALGDHGIDDLPSDGRTGFANRYAADDRRRSPTPAGSLVALIAAQQPAFHLVAGDICYADPQGVGAPESYTVPGAPFDNYDPFTWSTYFASIQRSAAATPWMFTTGNHDMEALYDSNVVPPRVAPQHGYGGHQRRLDLPTNGPSPCPSVYSFVHGNVAVLSLDANDLSIEIPANTGYSGGAQVAWLTGRLAAFRADPTIDFIVAFFHHCAYSTSATHASDGGVRDALAPLFDRYAVDLVVQGHNHQYERTNPIKASRSTRPAPDGSVVYPATDGTTYVLAGSGGRPRYPFQPGSKERFRGDGVPDSDQGAGPEVVNSYVWRRGGGAPVRGVTVDTESVDWSQVRYDNYAFLAVDALPAAPGATTTLTLRAVTDLGQEIDRLTLSRRAGDSSVPAAVAEVPLPLLLPAAGLAAAAAILALRPAAAQAGGRRDGPPGSAEACREAR